jgi:hypothetical protein
MAGIIYQTANVDPEPAEAYNSSISPSVLGILKKSLSKVPKERFSSAGEMASELKALMHESGKVPAKATEILSESSMGTLVEKSVSGLQQTSGPIFEKSEASEPLDFDDMDQMLAEDTGFDVGKDVAFKTTEGFTRKERIDYRQQDIASEGKESKLDLSELREVLAERKKRLAREDGAGAGDESDIVQDSEKAEWGWRPGTGADFGAEQSQRSILKLLRPAVFLVIIGVALTGATYYFWFSPNADYRLAKIIVNKYFGPKPPSPEEMLTKQKQLVEQIMKEKFLEEQHAAKAATTSPSEPREALHQADEIQKEQQRIAQEKIAAERKKEQERRAETEAAKQKEEDRRAAVEAARQREQERLARIAREKEEAAALAERQERARIEGIVQSEIKTISDLMSSARNHQKNKAYAKAKSAFEKALSVVQASAYQSDPRLTALKREIEGILATDEIVFGAKGYVHYNNQWLAPQDYEKVLYGKGYVKYRGQLVEYRTLENVILNKTKNVVTAFVTDKFKDAMVHSKNIKLINFLPEQSTPDFSRYQVDYKWEVWTFKGLDEGTCQLVVSYRVDEDKWYLIKGCD